MFKRNSAIPTAPFKLEGQLATTQQDLLPNLINTSSLQVNRFKGAPIIMQFMLGGIVLMLLRDLTTHFFSIFGPLKWKYGYLEKKLTKALERIQHIEDKVEDRINQKIKDQNDRFKALTAINTLKNQIKKALIKLNEDLNKEASKSPEIYNKATSELSMLEKEILKQQSIIDEIEQKKKLVYQVNEQITKVAPPEEKPVKMPKIKVWPSRTSPNPKAPWDTDNDTPWEMASKTVLYVFGFFVDAYNGMQYIAKQDLTLNKLRPWLFRSDPAREIDKTIEGNRDVIDRIRAENSQIVKLEPKAQNLRQLEKLTEAQKNELIDSNMPKMLKKSLATKPSKIFDNKIYKDSLKDVFKKNFDKHLEKNIEKIDVRISDLKEAMESLKNQAKQVLIELEGYLKEEVRSESQNPDTVRESLLGKDGPDNTDPL